ncbi:MAG: HAD-IA family hydrolase [Clostridia bacterium]|nr:HAD-IA family hydrolase [Clostridia bacterium]
MIKAILLDIDNTLLDFDAYVKESMRNGFEKFGLKAYTDSDYDTFTVINNGLWHEIEEGTLTFEELKKIRWNKVFEALGITFDGVYFEKYFREYLNESAIPVKGAKELISYLNGKGYILCAASNGPFDQQCNRLKIGKMYDCFTHFFISERVGYSKPAAEFFEVCFEELNKNGSFAKDEILMLGDSLSADIAGASDFGFKTCFFNIKNKDISGVKADYIISELSEITKLF